MAPGKPLGKSKGSKLNTIQHGSNTIKIGDCILINPDSSAGTSLPFIGRVKGITQPETGDTEIELTWFYRPEEAVGGRKAFHGEKELFASDHVDFVHKNTVLGKCRVMTLKKYQELPTVGEHDYFARFTYKPAKKEFEPDRVPVFCTCEMPYNPDKFMVMCDNCEEWYHPECLKMTKKAVAGISNWTCPECVQGGPASNKQARANGTMMR
eukprot:jgi/Chrzof1/12768/Cz07g06240.t1